MTLSEWAKDWPYTVQQHQHGARWTPDTYRDEALERHRVAAFHLSDYLVSSVTGGSIWFVPRKVSRSADNGDN